jgi:3-hydroxybutyrate dehydrogenase
MMKKSSNARTALITGGTGSIGASLVEAFTEAGYGVTFQYGTNEERALKLTEKWDARQVHADFLNGGDIGIPMEFDVLVNCAGINLTKSLTHKIDDFQFEQTLAVNVTTPFRLIRACLPYMMRREWGRIINVGSIYSLRATSNNAAYNVSKHALSGLTRSVALDYAGRGITCNEICPSAVESELMERIAKRKEAEGEMTSANYLEKVRASNPTGRMAMPNDLAGIAVFLASDDAGFINGVSIPVDGGQIAE